MKKILVTGSNGLLGQKIITQLVANKNIEVIATSTGKNRLPFTDGYIYEPLDITNKEAVIALIDKHQPNTIINTAAMTNVDACEAEKDKCWDLNVNAVKYLIASSDLVGAHLIHLSTDFIFDGENGPYKEEDKPNPLSYYGKSKLAAEELLQASSIKWAIARTIIVYGIVNKMSRSNVVIWAKEAMEKQSPINVVDDQFRSPTLAEDLAEGCVLIATKEAEGIYHLSGKDVMSILELVERVADYYQLDKTIITPIKSATLNQAAKRPPRTGFVLDKAINDLGYNPHSFEEGLGILTKQLN